jgi:hypothetical protein
MAFVVMVDTPGMSAGQYDKITELQGLDGGLPEGCLAHVAGPGPEGWRVVAVWESLEQAQEFMKTRVRPFQVELGVAPAKPPVIWPLHHLAG